MSFSLAQSQLSTLLPEVRDVITAIPFSVRQASFTLLIDARILVSFLLDISVNLPDLKYRLGAGATIPGLQLFRPNAAATPFDLDFSFPDSVCTQSPSLNCERSVL